MNICNGKFSHMCLLKPFVLKNPFLRAHFKWIMHNMHKIMHILKYGGVSVGTDSRNFDYRGSAEQVPGEVVRAALK